MFALFKKQQEAAGTVLFRGNLAPRAEDFESLRSQGIEITPAQPDRTWAWQATWRHDRWGEAQVGVFREPIRPPSDLFDFSNALTDAERTEARSGEMGVVVRVEGVKGDVLKDRKRLLWFMRQVMGREGVVAMDHLSTLMWSRGALDDEVAHDADLDIEGVYCLHAVYHDEPDDVEWMHSHGLAELGAIDFDILRPTEDLNEGARDLLRAIAFAIVEGDLTQNSAAFRLADPGGVVRAVDAAVFMSAASADDRALRDADEDHGQRRIVLCDPVRGLARFRRDIPRPSRFLSTPLAERTTIRFSPSATELMAARARATIANLSRAASEFAEFDVQPIAKIGYETDSGGGHEHLWFTVHGVAGDHVDATLESQPHNIASMRPGQRSMHDLERLSDWMVLTPAGPITPRNTQAARDIRENADRIRELIRLGAFADDHA